MRASPPGQARIALEDVRVGLGQHHLDVVHQRAEERPVARHLGERFAAVAAESPAPARCRRHTSRSGRRGSATRRTPRESRAASRSRRDASPTARAARARAEPQALDHVDRRGGAEVGREIRVLVDQRAVTGPRVGGRATRPARASAARAARVDAAAASRAAPRRWPAPGCAAQSRGYRICDGSPRLARSRAACRRPSRAARRSPRVRSCRRRG